MAICAHFFFQPQCDHLILIYFHFHFGPHDALIQDSIRFIIDQKPSFLGFSLPALVISIYFFKGASLLREGLPRFTQPFLVIDDRPMSPAFCRFLLILFDKTLSQYLWGSEPLPPCANHFAAATLVCLGRRMMPWLDIASYRAGGGSHGVEVD